MDDIGENEGISTRQEVKQSNERIARGPVKLGKRKRAQAIKKAAIYESTIVWSLWLQTPDGIAYARGRQVTPVILVDEFCDYWERQPKESGTTNGECFVHIAEEALPLMNTALMFGVQDVFNVEVFD